VTANRPKHVRVLFIFPFYFVTSILSAFFCQHNLFFQRLEGFFSTNIEIKEGRNEENNLGRKISSNLLYIATENIRWLGNTKGGGFGWQK
jgi:hypothetical protein